MGCSKEKLVCKSHTHFHQHTLELGQDTFVFFFSRTFIFTWNIIVLCCVGIANNLLTGEIVNVSSLVDAQLQCTFLSWFTGSAHCRIQYGTDPTYLNLPCSAESTETVTAGDTVSVVLREWLNSTTTLCLQLMKMSLWPYEESSQHHNTVSAMLSSQPCSYIAFLTITIKQSVAWE